MKNEIKAKTKDIPQVFIIDVDEVSEELFYFCTNSYNLGIY